MRIGRGFGMAVGAALLALTVAGCSLVGFGVGSAIDRHRSPWSAVSDFSTVAPGTLLRIGLEGGDTLSGRFAGASPDSIALVRGHQITPIAMKQLAWAAAPTHHGQKAATVGLALGLAIDVSVALILITTAADR
jgi:hypothetical protein